DGSQGRGTERVALLPYLLRWVEGARIDALPRHREESRASRAQGAGDVGPHGRGTVCLPRLVPRREPRGTLPSGTCVGTRRPPDRGTVRHDVARTHDPTGGPPVTREDLQEAS